MRLRIRIWPRWVRSSSVPGVRLFDTAAGRVVPFEVGPVVSMYTCGITPYDSTHLGHAATYLSYDVLQRRLRDLGHETRFRSLVFAVARNKLAEHFRRRDAQKRGGGEEALLVADPDELYDRNYGALLEKWDTILAEKNVQRVTIADSEIGS